ncbi:MAG: hypothetical protein COB77_06165 [Gammaproteobacteria bacterium]|nr:PilZ domain-containing protein [Gammaproteobacteria bacterium]PCI06724.1 MAG: hypothetical protein COB77_06165 [Gammaproteobacteria bacterium]
MIHDIPSISERRQSPRYSLKLAIELVLPDNSILNVTTRNISGSGLQIVCDRWATEAIEPRGIQNHALSDLRLKVITDLSVAGETKKLYANCRIMSAQRMSQDEFILNLAFIDFDNGTEKNLDAFFNQHVQKKTLLSAVV